MVVAVICGGGNGAHVMAGIGATQPNVEVRVLTLFEDEAERWSKAMETESMTVKDTTGPKERSIVSKPSRISKKPEDVVPGCDILMFCVPAFAHEQYLTVLKPHVQPGTILVGLPAQSGFIFAVRSIWGDLAKKCTLMNFITLPWNCRILEFGKKALMMSMKTTVPGVMLESQPPPAENPVKIAQSVLGARPILEPKGHFLGMSLSPSNPILHPTVMYGTWSDWDGKPVDRKPLFYNDLSEKSANILHAISDEVCAIAKSIMEQRPQVDLTNVRHAEGYYRDLYGDEVEDKTNIYTILRTCSGFTGLEHPMITTEDGKFVPNFNFRYLWEDIPFGMAVIKGIADIAGVATPNLDKVLVWGQGKMGKEFVVDGKFTGKDIGMTRAPQAFGLKTMDEMLALK